MLSDGITKVGVVGGVVKLRSGVGVVWCLREAGGFSLVCFLLVLFFFFFFFFF